MKVVFLTTGGTIDKDYASKAGTYNFEIAEPAVKRVIESIKPRFEFEVRSILKKDSLDMSEEDRQTIYDACSESNSDKIIITHGTDTMVKTANKLSGIKDKTIVLVGSSKPEKFKDSDAQFNIGVAIGAIHLLNCGTYVAMNGRIFPCNNVKKAQDGNFETEIQ